MGWQLRKLQQIAGLELELFWARFCQDLIALCLFPFSLVGAFRAPSLPAAAPLGEQKVLCLSSPQGGLHKCTRVQLPSPALTQLCLQDFLQPLWESSRGSFNFFFYFLFEAYSSLLEFALILF